MLPFELTKDTPYLALSGELWSVFYEYFNRNWPCYKGFLLYLQAEDMEGWNQSKGLCQQLNTKKTKFVVFLHWPWRL